MVDLAITRVSAEDRKRLRDLTKLKREILDASRKHGYHFGRLPLEVCGQVLDLVVAENHSNLLKLIGVSRSWNSIVWNTSSLWSVLSLKNVLKPTWKARRWIDQSKGTIRLLVLPANPHGWIPSALDGIRWERLEAWSHESPLLRLHVPSFPPLISLRKFEWMKLSTPSETVWILDHPNGPKSLSHLQLECDVLPWPSIISQTNLTTLHLNLMRFEFDGLVSLMRTCTLLQSLVIVSAYPQSSSANIPHAIPLTSTDDPEIVQMGHLEELEIGITDSANILPIMRMPNLRRLRLAHCNYPFEGMLETLLESGVALLETFEFEGSHPQSGAPFINLLRQAPRLERLVLTRINPVAPVLDALASSESPLCPNLTHLNVSRCPDARSGPLVRLVKDRLPRPSLPGSPEESGGECADHPSGIVSLTMDGCPHVDHATLPWLRQQVKKVSCVYLTKKEASFRR